MEKPNVMQYKSHVEFLGDYYSYLKSQNSKTSYGAIGIKLGISESYARMLFSGEREFTPAILESFCKLAEFGHVQEIYFNVLTKSAIHLKVGTTADQEDTDTLVEIFLGELVQMEDFRPDPEWLCKRLGDIFTPDRTGNILKNWLADGVLENSSGEWKYHEYKLVRHKSDPTRDVPREILKTALKIHEASDRSTANISVIPMKKKDAEEVYKKIVSVLHKADVDVNRKGRLSEDLFAFTLALAQATKEVTPESYLK